MSTGVVRVLAGALAALVLAATAALAPAPGAASAPPATRPNVVFIMLDDVPSGMLDAMPAVQRLLQDRGVTFRNGMVPTSLCCPSRASTLTGRYAHTTGVYTNRNDGYGGWAAFRRWEPKTIAAEMQRAGYRTALVGKYMNGFGFSTPGRSYVPPGWSSFVAFHGRPGYYNYDLSGTVQEQRGDNPTDYSTDVLTNYAVDAVRATPANQPLFLYYAPYAAHAPYIPAPRYVDTWRPEPLDASANEADMSDKARFMQRKPLVDLNRQVQIQQRMHETLRSVDDGVQNIVNALGNRLDNTLVVLMSDNGYLLGGHRLTGKNFPYARSTNVPMVMRFDGRIDPGSTSYRVMLNIDLAATIADAAGVSQRGMEGMSYFSRPRQGTVLEQMASVRPGIHKSHPAYCGYRTRRWLFVEWSGNKGRELYDYRSDPYELRNLAQRSAFQATMRQLRQRAVRTCDPVPPGFTWSRQ